jgi:radical SAM superfamily enzyme YgiQ (UPF0313 family)|tara:strand:- start:5851 stop:7233 length:1383 start_codon:yes stop_codon:yes gene_type:complete
MSDVILVYPPYSFDEEKQRFLAKFSASPPLGILYLASALEKNAVKVKIIDAMAAQLKLEDVVKLIEKEGAQVVGISATTPQTRGAVQLAEALKRILGNSIIIGLGGPHVTTDPDFIHRFPYFDFGFIGEGELTFPSLVEKMLNESFPWKRPAIFRGEHMSNLDDIPLPARHLLEKDIYGEADEQFAPIMSSRGCPYDCVFCSKPVAGRSVRYRSPENVVDEIESVDVGYIVFADDTFTLNKKITLKLCREIIDRKLDVGWQCETRANLVDEDLLKVMKRAGCKKIEFGIESGNERVRTNIVHKNPTNEQIRKTFSLCRKVGIETAAYLMLGFPTETREDMRETVAIGKNLGADYIGVHLTIPMPGSELCSLAKQDGRISEDVWDRYAKGEIEEQPIYVPEDLTLDEMKKAQKNAYRQFYFQRRFILKRLAQDICSIRRLKHDIAVALSLLKHGRTATGRP